jgi:ribonuclease P protein subunit POP4
MPRPSAGSTEPSLAQQELIGLDVRIVGSGHPGFVGLHGKVVDETMKTLTIETAQGEKVIAKAGQEFEFTTPQGQERVQGEQLAHRPEDRIRKAARRSPQQRSTR